MIVIREHDDGRPLCIVGPLWWFNLVVTWPLILFISLGEAVSVLPTAPVWMRLVWTVSFVTVRARGQPSWACKWAQIAFATSFLTRHHAAPLVVT